MAILKLTSSGGGVQSIDTPSTSSNFTSTLPGTTGTLLNSASSLAAANLTGTVVDARISALTASKLTGALPAISGANLTGIASGGLTQLASFATTSGTTVAITGLNLSTYKFLYITQNGVGFASDTGGAQTVIPNGGSVVRWTAGTGPSNSFYTNSVVDLSTGIGSGMYLAAAAATIINGTGGTVSFRNTGISTSTTSLTFGTDGNVAFARGNMKLYGLK